MRAENALVGLLGQFGARVPDNPLTKGTPQVGRLRNLAGRAGRGGLFASGSLIVMVKSEAQVQKWMRAFRAELPPTTSALHQALDHLRSTADHLADGTPARRSPPWTR